MVSNPLLLNNQLKITKAKSIFIKTQSKEGKSEEGEEGRWSFPNSLGWDWVFFFYNYLQTIVNTAAVCWTS